MALSAADLLVERTFKDFLMDRPEAFDVLSDTERRVAVASLSDCSFQRRTVEELSAEFGVSRRCIADWQRAAIGKLRHFQLSDPKKCPHCHGKGWLDHDD